MKLPTQLSKPVAVFTGYARKDWIKYIDWAVPMWSYTKTQHRHKLKFPTIYDKDDKYIDRRTRFKKVEVRIIMEERE